MKFTLYEKKKTTKQTNKIKQKQKQKQKQKDKEKRRNPLSCHHLSSELLVTYATYRKTCYFAYTCLLFMNPDFSLKYYNRL